MDDRQIGLDRVGRRRDRDAELGRVDEEQCELLRRDQRSSSGCATFRQDFGGAPASFGIAVERQGASPPSRTGLTERHTVGTITTSGPVSAGGGGWIWIAGAWRVPPFPGATWKAWVYVQLGGKYVLVPGGWSEK